ncbi:MAG TPA: tRNA pseudouridine(55) synthase TruB [Fimbriimonadaceae bacterium]|nr:tRNA pseudouridine(55) synthase TruB [Fimbriimonadaceae bacterium]
MLGILLIHKPEGCTSHDVVNIVRRRFETRRVGHAGTLDPLATGLLVVAVGPATRFLQYLPLEPKEYIAQIAFGASTSTQDREGVVTAEREPPDDVRTAWDQAVPGFKGLIQQIPPLYSAVKKDGRPLYAYARAGLDVEREPRTVHIETLEWLSLSTAGGRPVVEARVICSGGTYVRTLAHDLGERIGCGAHLHSLVRTGVGKFRLQQAKPLDEVAPEDLMPLREALPPMPIVRLDPQQEGFVRDGRQIRLREELDAFLVGLGDEKGDVFGVARLTDRVLQPEVVMPREATYGTA